MAGGTIVDLFDIVGPVMIGPSSSHTAGAARIGRVARRILGEEPISADIAFHGSFASTWQGHGTDLAILGGLLGLDVDDPRLRNSREIAGDRGMQYRFRTVVLEDSHPNTVLLSIAGADGKPLSVKASSPGGGRILVQSIDGLEAGFTGEMPTLVIRHQDSPGVIADVSRCLSASDINIASMRVFRSKVGGMASMVLELDETPLDDVVQRLSTVRFVASLAMIDRL